MSPSLSRISLLASAAALLSSCTSGGAPDNPAVALRQRFPDQAERVLRGEGSFSAGETAFALNRGSGLVVELPRAAGSAVVLRGDGGFEVRVREVGIEGDGALAEGAVAYRRAGGTSFWTATAGGVEEWLHLGAGVAAAGKVVAAWEVEGATLQQHGEAVEVVPHGVATRLRVTAPTAYGRCGGEVTANLRVREDRIELSVDAHGEPVLVDPKWTLTVGSMAHTRSGHTATMLLDGRVLVRGGTGNTGADTSAEIYDPASQEFSDAASATLTVGRWYHAATLISATGEVIVTGGYWSYNQVGGGAQNTVEAFEPSTMIWTMTTPMSVRRMYHTATTLDNGRLMVAGGTSGGDIPLNSIEIRDPTSHQWATPQSSAMKTARWGHTATQLGDGKVLVTGGTPDNTNDLNSAELFDPSSNTWSLVANMNTARRFHTATLLDAKHVLVTGGSNSVSGYLQDAEVYDEDMNTWTATPTVMTSPRRYHTATLLNNGKVLVTGGSDGPVLKTTEMYAGGTFAPSVSMNDARDMHTATLLLNGDVLVIGGGLVTAELFHLDTGGPCTMATDCESGFCVDAVCCNSACNAGPCEACSVAAGAQTDGTCGPVPGQTCASSSSSSSGSDGGATSSSSGTNSSSTSSSTSSSGGSTSSSTSSSGGSTSSSTSSSGGSTSSSSGAGGAPGTGGAASGGAGTGGSTNFYGCAAAPGAPAGGGLSLLALGLLLRRRRRACA